VASFASASRKHRLRKRECAPSSQQLEQVRHVNPLLGDIGEAAVLARHDKLSIATLVPFHPIGFMLAQPLLTAEEIAVAMPSPFVVEDKDDGIRAQAHTGENAVRHFSRTLDDISHGYPEILAALQRLGDGLVHDGELIAIDPAEPTRAFICCASNTPRTQETEHSVSSSNPSRLCRV